MTQSPTASVTYSLSHLQPQSPTASVTYSLSHLQPQSPTASVTYSLCHLQPYSVGYCNQASGPGQWTRPVN